LLQQFDRESLLPANSKLEGGSKEKQRSIKYLDNKKYICLDECNFEQLEIMENDSEETDSDNEEQLHLDENGNIRYSFTNNSFSHDDNNKLINFDPNADISENLLGIFVVSFDAKLGNLIEWQMPANLDLKHIEFKAMASGFHLISNDLVLVKFRNLEKFMKL
jgi:hypothetical protein